jgi:uncharacterized phosphosugar-binding protein
MLALAYKKYQQLLTKKMNLAFQQEEEITKAASILSHSLSTKGWIYACGTGHSHLLAEETGSTDEERKEGYAPILFQEYAITKNDALLISSNSGRNAVPIELANYAREQGAKVIVITNLAHSKSVSSRHASGLKLYQLGDVVLDNFGEIGDAALTLDGLDTPVGPTSTAIGTALLQAICVEATAQLLAQGITPEVFASSNSDQGASHNDALLEVYKPLVKML